MIELVEPDRDFCHATVAICLVSAKVRNTDSGGCGKLVGSQFLSGSGVGRSNVLLLTSPGPDPVRHRVGIDVMSVSGPTSGWDYVREAFEGCSLGKRYLLDKIYC